MSSRSNVEPLPTSSFNVPFFGVIRSGWSRVFSSSIPWKEKSKNRLIIENFYLHLATYLLFCLFYLESMCFFLSLQQKQQTEMLMATQEMQQLIANYFKTQPVLKAWIFGSYSRGEQREDSDVDILIQVDRSQPVGLFKLSGMHLDLQDLLGLPVDLVTVKGLMDFARESVDRDKILIYERAA